MNRPSTERTGSPLGWCGASDDREGLIGERKQLWIIAPERNELHKELREVVASELFSIETGA
jgi:hypothetical protein